MPNRLSSELLTTLCKFLVVLHDTMSKENVESMWCDVGFGDRRHDFRREVQECLDSGYPCCIAPNRPSIRYAVMKESRKDGCRDDEGPVKR